jgi:hypothetical protein
VKLPNAAHFCKPVGYIVWGRSMVQDQMRNPRVFRIAVRCVLPVGTSPFSARNDGRFGIDYDVTSP